MGYIKKRFGDLLNQDFINLFIHVSYIACIIKIIINPYWIIELGVWFYILALSIVCCVADEILKYYFYRKEKNKNKK